MSKKKLKIILKIIIPIVILGILTSLYFIKNASDEPIEDDINIPTEEPVIKGDSSNNVVENEDPFADAVLD
jgi:hypothetical protein